MPRKRVQYEFKDFIAGEEWVLTSEFCVGTGVPGCTFVKFMKGSILKVKGIEQENGFVIFLCSDNDVAHFSIENLHSENIKRSKWKEERIPVCQYCKEPLLLIRAGEWQNSCDCDHPSFLNRGQERMLRNSEFEVVKNLMKEIDLLEENGCIWLPENYVLEGKNAKSSD